VTAEVVHGVLVTHTWHDELERVIARCAAEVHRLRVVDNGNASPRLATLAASLANVEIVNTGGNVGIAAALNAGVAPALAQGARWVLTMDHDTMLPEGAVRAMLAGALECGGPGATNIAIIAPRYRIRGKDVADGSRDPDRARPCRLLPDVITSANLVSAAAFERAGMFAADYFIDYVDFEFCLRVRGAGMSIVEIPSVVVDHRLGEVRERAVLGARVRHTHYGRMRRYLKARNRVRTYRRHFARFPAWVLADVWGIPWELASAAVFEDDRLGSIGAMLAGLTDGLMDRSGPPPQRYRSS
jgi:rhamnosyltransferase